ncbi:hypothetical protein BDQ17DRAFT_1340049 [Cyathus striatus]|nr:hypothetical protein BDQ17DRAFT_1340049 [Cyathus striatus]
MNVSATALSASKLRVFMTETIFGGAMRNTYPNSVLEMLAASPGGPAKRRRQCMRTWQGLYNFTGLMIGFMKPVSFGLTPPKPLLKHAAMSISCPFCKGDERYGP